MKIPHMEVAGSEVTIRNP